jgi:choline kinase
LQVETELNAGIEYEPVISQLTKQISIACVHTDKLAWIEIDFPEDVERAKREIYPRISPTLRS